MKKCIAILAILLGTLVAFRAADHRPVCNLLAKVHVTYGNNGPMPIPTPAARMLAERVDRDLPLATIASEVY